MIICADDYGMRADIDRAILQLCGDGKLSAVSCMVLFERCDGALLEKLRAHEARVDIGLHFCQTHENLPLSRPLENTALPQFKTLFRRALLRSLKREEVTALLAAQYDLFVKKAGRTPDYIDGHLHAHQLPVVAPALVDFVRQLPAGQRPYIRNTRLCTRELRQQNLPSLKAGFIGAFGRRLEQRLRAADVATNDGFSGIYDFKEWARYPEFFPKFTACLPGQNGILVTHPGWDEDWRRSEFETLQKYAGSLNRFQR
ncbi:MAG: ChbG/HpnK family deacetylase [Verrucomicrobiae bacterium]|nr:ChbG/HpnK family deacetylase [Verrucomicrobiae bacterium]